VLKKSKNLKRYPVPGQEQTITDPESPYITELSRSGSGTLVTVNINNEYQMLLRRKSKRGEYEKGDEITRVKDSRS
jgi:phage-related protein